MNRFLLFVLSGLCLLFVNCNDKDKSLTPKVETISVTDITATSVVLKGEVISEEGGSAYKRGFVWHTSPTPTTDHSFSDNGSGAGVFTFELKQLQSRTTYYVRAYAINAYGTSYGKELSFTTLSGIGDTAGGGIIFYLDGKGGGLVAAASDQSPGVKWGCMGTSISTTKTIVGSGAENTQAIITVCTESGIAAKLCDNLVLNGYDDWFLPSKDELKLMYDNLHQQGFGGFSNSNYWSSSEFNSSNSWYQNFSNGEQNTASKSGNTIKVRAVRAF